MTYVDAPGTDNFRHCLHCPVFHVLPVGIALLCLRRPLNWHVHVFLFFTTLFSTAIASTMKPCYLIADKYLLICHVPIVRAVLRQCTPFTSEAARTRRCGLDHPLQQQLLILGAAYFNCNLCNLLKCVTIARTNRFSAGPMLRLIY